jgi:hypothetical protein
VLGKLNNAEAEAHGPAMTAGEDDA